MLLLSDSGVLISSSRPEKVVADLNTITRTGPSLTWRPSNRPLNSQRFSRFTTSDAASRHRHGRDRQTAISSNACQTGSTSDLVSCLLETTAGASDTTGCSPACWATATGASYGSAGTISVVCSVGSVDGLGGVYGRIRLLNIQGGGGR
jgi:hypothetical protein